MIRYRPTGTFYKPNQTKYTPNKYTYKRTLQSIIKKMIRNMQDFGWILFYCYV